MYDDVGFKVVRSDSASVLVPTIDLEIPATGQKGEVGLSKNPQLIIR